MAAAAREPGGRLRALLWAPGWPVALRAWVSTVEVAVLAVLVASAATQGGDLGPAVLGTAALVAGAALTASYAGNQGLGRSPTRGVDPAADLNSVWVLVGALFLPTLPAVGLALLLELAGPTTPGRHRVANRLFNGSTFALGAAAVSLVTGWLGPLLGGPRGPAPDGAPWGPFGLLGRVPGADADPAGLLVVCVAGALVLAAVNAAVVGQAAHLAYGAPRLGALGGWRGVASELAALSAGALVAVAASRSLVALLLAVPASALLQRSLVHGELLSAARTDGKTGLLHAAGWDQVAGPVLARQQAAGRSVAVAVLDLDRFKTVNDRYGHRAGDQLLAAVATAFQAALRPGDVCGRLGGDEFVVLAPAGDADPVAEAERWRAAVGGAAREHANDVVVTASVGMALSRPGEPLAALLDRADAALYRAKAAGRDTVRLDDPQDVGTGP